MSMMAAESVTDRPAWRSSVPVPVPVPVTGCQTRGDEQQHGHRHG